MCMLFSLKQCGSVLTVSIRHIEFTQLKKRSVDLLMRSHFSHRSRSSSAATALTQLVPWGRDFLNEAERQESARCVRPCTCQSRAFVLCGSRQLCERALLLQNCVRKWITLSITLRFYARAAPAYSYPSAFRAVLSLVSSNGV